MKLHHSTPTCTHCHGCPGDHPHGRNAVVARGGDGDGCGVEGCGGDAVGLHHSGVMDHMRLSRIDGLGVVSSLENNTHVREARLGEKDELKQTNNKSVLCFQGGNVNVDNLSFSNSGASLF